MKVKQLEKACRLMLDALGEDVTREGLRDTPRRFAEAWIELLSPPDGKNLERVFSSAELDQLVVVGPVRVWSVCEHHLLPFYADVYMGYLASHRVLGLSKFARHAQRHARALQLQERLTGQIADAICKATKSQDVAVFAKGQHLCMAMRGARSDALMTTSVMRGKFRDTPALRSEFLSLCR
jgi:GTP cyclohydrolase I